MLLSSAESTYGGVDDPEVGSPGVHAASLHRLGAVGLSAWPVRQARRRDHATMHATDRTAARP